MPAIRVILNSKPSIRIQNQIFRSETMLTGLLPRFIFYVFHSLCISLKNPQFYKQRTREIFRIERTEVVLTERLTQSILSLFLLISENNKKPFMHHWPLQSETPNEISSLLLLHALISSFNRVLQIFFTFFHPLF